MKFEYKIKYEIDCPHCTASGRPFQTDSLEEAKQHFNNNPGEAKYDKMLLKQKKDMRSDKKVIDYFNFQPVLLSKQRVNWNYKQKKHEHIYSVNYKREMINHGGIYSGLFPEDGFNHEGFLSQSEIEEKIKNKEWEGLTKKELSKIVKTGIHLEERVWGKEKDFKTIKTSE